MQMAKECIQKKGKWKSELPFDIWLLLWQQETLLTQPSNRPPVRVLKLLSKGHFLRSNQSCRSVLNFLSQEMAEALRKQKSRSSSVDPSSNEEEQIWRDLCDGLWQLARQLERTRKKTSKINSVNTRMKERREACMSENAQELPVQLGEVHMFASLPQRKRYHHRQRTNTPISYQNAIKLWMCRKSTFMEKLALQPSIASHFPIRALDGVLSKLEILIPLRKATESGILQLNIFRLGLTGAHRLAGFQELIDQNDVRRERSRRSQKPR